MLASSPTGLGAGAGPESDVFGRLLRERIVFLTGEVTDETANELNAKLLLLDAEDPTRDIAMLHQLAGRIGLRRYGDLRHDALRHR